MKKLLAVMITLLSAGKAFAAGFEFKESAAPAIGRGLAVNAKLDDASTTFFNPAGIAYLQGFNLSIGGVAVIPLFRYSDPEGKRESLNAVDEVHSIPHFYAANNFSEKFGAGVAFNAPFGLALKWPFGFAGEHKTAAVDLKVTVLTLAAAYSPDKMFSFGIGLRLIPTSVEMIQRIGFVTDAGEILKGYAHLGGNAFGFGATAGFMVRPTDKLFIGGSYVSRAKLSYSGDADFGLPEGVSDASTFHDQGASLSIWLPDIISLGIGYMLLDYLYLEFDYNYTIWSVINEIKLNFDDAVTRDKIPPFEKNWNNTSTFRFGGEYTLSDSFKLRGAYVYDFSPVPDSTLDPMLPDANRHVIYAGLGYTYRPLGISVDFAYDIILFEKRSVTASDGNDFPATYDSIGHMFALTFSVRQ